MTEQQDGAAVEEHDEVLYEVDNGLAWITINRPHRYNAYRGRTIDLLIESLLKAWAEDSVGVVALTGAGDKAFSAGGDQKQRHETGDCNAVVPQGELHAEVRRWADEMLAMAPTTLRFLKYSFNVDTEQFAGVEWLATSALATFGDSPEVVEGVSAFNEKRPPDFSAFRANAYRGA